MMDKLADDFIDGEYIPFQDAEKQKSSHQSPLAELTKSILAEPPAKKKKGTDVQDSCSI